MRIKDAAQIAKEYDIPQAELARRIRTDRNFAAQILEYKRIWHHPTNAAERVRIKAAVLAEDGLINIWNIFQNPDTHPAVRLDAHKHLTKLADVEPKKDLDAQGSRFSVTINLPNVDPMEVVATVADASEDLSDAVEAA